MNDTEYKCFRLHIYASQLQNAAIFLDAVYKSISDLFFFEQC